MARYFLDTGVLLGITFLHDLWRDEAQRLFETENTLYTSQAVIYEYCNNERSTSFNRAAVDWESEKGRYGEKFSKVRAAQVNLDLKLRTYDDDELGLEALVDVFISETGIDEAVYPPSKIDKYIRPNIRDFLVDFVGEQEVTCEVAREAMDALCDTIQTEARATRERLRRRIRLGPERSGDWKKTRDRLKFVSGRMDRIILCDAAHMSDENILERVITADKNDIYENRERINAMLGLRILFVKDEFAESPLSADSVEDDARSEHR